MRKKNEIGYFFITYHSYLPMILANPGKLQVLCKSHQTKVNLMNEIYHTLVLFRSSLPKIIFLSRCLNNIVNMYFVLKDSSFLYNPDTFPVISQIKVWTSNTMRLFKMLDRNHIRNTISTLASLMFSACLQCYLTVPSNWFKRKKTSND